MTMLIGFICTLNEKTDDMRYTTQFADGGGINLTKWMCARKVEKIEPPVEWTKHTSFHWSRQINGKRWIAKAEEAQVYRDIEEQCR